MNYIKYGAKIVLLTISGILLLTACGQKEPDSAKLDGSYAIDVDFEGGSGRAFIENPAMIEINGDAVVAKIRWSSPNYDYMLVDDVKYLPVNKEGNSEFEIPVKAFDEKLRVIGDTVAMSTPHEVEYYLTFKSSTITSASDTPMARSRYSLYVAIAIMILCAVVSLIRKKRRKKFIAKMQNEE